MRQNTPEDPPQTTPDAKNSPRRGPGFGVCGGEGIKFLSAATSGGRTQLGEYLAAVEDGVIVEHIAGVVLGVDCLGPSGLVPTLK